jgi:extradiol dioxygenase family protein
LEWRHPANRSVIAGTVARGATIRRAGKIPRRCDKEFLGSGAVEPILHLSLPARDLAEGIDFYVESLGCELGRVRDHFADVWFFGMQVTLHDAPDQVRAPGPGGVHHFGVTLAASEMDELVARAESRGVAFASPVSTDYPGTPHEQTKTKILDPSGNVIEIKTYVDPAVALGRHLRA